MKRILTIQDISCVGKCSLTVALPILSACSLETAVLPTAVLSTHTMFKNGFTFHDLTGEIAPICEHWKREGLGFSCVYTGYLGSFEQLGLVSRLFDEFREEESIYVVDPVMADNGKLYPGFTPEFAAKMAGLCGKADVILPNLTEASFLLGIPYEPDPSPERVRELLKMLCGLGAKIAVLTGVREKERELGVASYNSVTGEFFTYYNEHLPVTFHGTGDVFASAVTGGLARGLSIEKALPIAVDFTVESIRKTMADPQARSYGVNFEEALPMLMERIL